jgi:hypothetical protein
VLKEPGSLSRFLCRKNVILKEFKNTKDYKNYINKVIKESSAIKGETRKYLLE